MVSRGAADEIGRFAPDRLLAPPWRFYHRPFPAWLRATFSALGAARRPRWLGEGAISSDEDAARANLARPNAGVRDGASGQPVSASWSERGGMPQKPGALHPTSAPAARNWSHRFL